ncbi:hypothetical protein BS47DRAFT_434080 [Hydnum rufescens UP504]|uniref:Uncharacterized protein n=1 Tax=Hydnum rufescens UP504 TaxID=1448309 RepID=A0A9P6AJD7_9AGAM|nr:hypothetical protein BS47DRAFT_434080 [Hydnum rufescens UP504]
MAWILPADAECYTVQRPVTLLQRGQTYPLRPGKRSQQSVLNSSRQEMAEVLTVGRRKRAFVASNHAEETRGAPGGYTCDVELKLLSGKGRSSGGVGSRSKCTIDGKKDL